MDRQVNYGSNNIFATVFIVPFLVSMILLDHFWFWCLFGIYFVLIGVYLILLSIASQLEHIRNSFKRIILRISLIGTAAGMIVFYALVLMPSIRDIPNYINQKHEYVVGTLEEQHKIYTSKKAGLWMNIKVNGVNLKSTRALSKDKIDKILFVEYLPHSKYVLKIWVQNK